MAFHDERTIYVAWLRIPRNDGTYSPWRRLKRTFATPEYAESEAQRLAWWLGREGASWLALPFGVPPVESREGAL